MGPENEQKTVLYMNGQSLGPFEGLQTVTFEPNEVDEKMRFLGVDFAQGGDFTATFTPKFPHVSRKRFVRNLVKAGCPKKKAKKIAWKAKKPYGYANFLAKTVGWPKILLVKAI